MKHTFEKLLEAVENSESVTGVLKYLNITVAGGNHSHITRRIKDAGINTDHFTGQASNRGKTFEANRRTAESIFIKRYPPNQREQARLLKRAMLETGVEYRCVGCGNRGTWLGEKMTLQVDHINEDWLDDRRDNLRFLCPNCHFVQGRLNASVKKWEENIHEYGFWPMVLLGYMLRRIEVSSTKLKEKRVRKDWAKPIDQKNSQYGTCWIYSLEYAENMKIKVMELDLWIKRGWLRGRKMKF